MAKVINGYMVDMDGTLCRGEEIIPGAREFISKLVEKNIPFVILTNNSSVSTDNYVKKFRGMGFDVTKDHVLTATTATMEYLKTEYPGKTVFPLGTPEFVEELLGNNIKVVDSAPDVVLLAYDKTITFDKINKAYHFLAAGATFVATHPDKYCLSKDGLDVDIEPFIRLLEYVSEKKATIVGKPKTLMGKMAARKLNVNIENLAMIGDRLYTDMEMAIHGDMISILVLSGETTKKKLETFEEKDRIDYVIGSVDELTPML